MGTLVISNGNRSHCASGSLLALGSETPPLLLLVNKAVSTCRGEKVGWQGAGEGRQWRGELAGWGWTGGRCSRLNCCPLNLCRWPYLELVFVQVY